LAKRGHNIAWNDINNFLNTQYPKLIKAEIAAQRKYGKKIAKTTFKCLGNFKKVDEDLAEVITTLKEGIEKIVIVKNEQGKKEEMVIVEKDYHNFLRALGEIREWTKLRAQLEGQLATGDVYNTQINIEVVQFKDALLRVLNKHPDIKKEVILEVGDAVFEIRKEAEQSKNV